LLQRGQQQRGGESGLHEWNGEAALYRKRALA
jgi:hypothetical protein